MRTLVTRPSTVAVHVAAVLVSIVIAPEVQAQCDVTNEQAEVATGIVFDDLDRDGQRGSREPGVGRVSVSNGCDVVVTDSNGAYRIRLAEHQILFVSQPAGYVVPVDEHNLPLFFYSHYPDGSPAAVAGAPVEWAWPVIEPTGPLPDSIDFPLHQLSARETRFTAHAFADPQARDDLGEDMLREDLVNTLLGNPYDAKFSITVGDVVFDNLGLYERHKKMVGLIGIPQWNLPGNHDINFESPNARYANERSKSTLVLPTTLSTTETLTWSRSTTSSTRVWSNGSIAGSFQTIRCTGSRGEWPKP